MAFLKPADMCISRYVQVQGEIRPTATAEETPGASGHPTPACYLPQVSHGRVRVPLGAKLWSKPAVRDEGRRSCVHSGQCPCVVAQCPCNPKHITWHRCYKNWQQKLSRAPAYTLIPCSICTVSSLLCRLPWTRQTPNISYHRHIR